MDILEHIVAFFSYLLQIFLHLDTYLNIWAGQMGVFLYALLFVVIFCETGVVVFPFLPGDSLLFAIGALAASDNSPIKLQIILLLLPIACILGDTTNYYIGHKLGPKVFRAQDSWLLNKKHLNHANDFYKKHGAKTIVLARFVPVVRTFAPFVAGIGAMNYRKFIGYSVFGCVAWMLSFTIGGYYFGNQPWVKSQFHYVVVAIIVISVLPAVFEIVRHRMSQKKVEIDGIR